MNGGINRIYYVVFMILLILVVVIGLSSCSLECWGFNGYLRLANFSSQNTGFLISSNWAVNLYLQFYLGILFLAANIFGVLTGRKPCIYIAILSAVTMVLIEVLISGYFYPAFPQYTGIGGEYLLLIDAYMTLVIIIQVFIPLLYKYRGR